MEYKCRISAIEGGVMGRGEHRAAEALDHRKKLILDDLRDEKKRRQGNVSNDRNTFNA